MAAGPEPAAATGEWYQIVMPSLAITAASILAFIGAYFKKATEQSEASAPTGNVVAKAVGAAFVDDSTAAAVLRIDVNVAALAKAARDRAEKDHDDEIAERAAERAAELAAEVIERRLAKKKE